MIDVAKYDEILARGLCSGKGALSDQMCIEAAVCLLTDERFDDHPSCVDPYLVTFVINLNDSSWSSPEARAKGLRNLGLAQLGTNGMFDQWKFRDLILPKLREKMVPELAKDLKVTEAYLRAEGGETKLWVWTAKAAVRSLDNRSPIYFAQGCQAAWHLYENGSVAERTNDKYLMMAADLAVEVLREANSPGAALC